MNELRGKGWRVVGYFLWMLSSGLVLDGAAPATGRLGLACGAGLFVLGVVQSWRGRDRQRE